jgi:hypothetical protein
MLNAPATKESPARAQSRQNISIPQSLSKVYTHIIFSTKHRKSLIDDTIENDLYKTMCGICKDLECNPVQFGGHKNHVHKKTTVLILMNDLCGINLSGLRPRWGCRMV